MSASHVDSRAQAEGTSGPDGSAEVRNQEIEWQFDALDLRPVDRWLREVTSVGPGSDGGVTATPKGVRRHTDVYADTVDWRLHRGGRILRVRRRAGGFEATIKSIQGAEDGLRRRDEITQDVSNSDLHALTRTDGSVSEWVRRVVGTHPLEPVVEVRTQRSAFDLSLNGATVGEVALDSTTIPIGTGEEPARLRRIEVEVDASSLEAVRPFVEALRDVGGLRPATVSKMEAGLLAAGLSPASYVDFGSTAVEASSTVGEAAFAILRTQLRAFLGAEPGTRLGVDPEQVHDMRVATRRLRAALKLFAEALPVRADRFRQELKWVGTVLGEVRDLDVQLARLEEWGGHASAADRDALEELRVVLESEHAAARARLMAALDGARYERLVAGFGGMLRQGPLRRSPASRVPILAAAPDLVGRRYRSVRRRGRRIDPDSSGEDYHALRIRTKRLRYAVEFVGPVYGKRARRLARRLVALQDLLGDHQDALVAVDRLRGLVEEVGPTLSPPTLFAMGAMAEGYAARARERKSAFANVFRRIRKPWRRLERRMARRRPGLPPLRPRPMPAPAPEADVSAGAP